MIKKYSLMIIVSVVVMMSGIFALNAEAASSDAVTIKVTVTPSISVSITEDTLSFGAIAAGAAPVSATAVTVTNNGSGVNETYSLSLSNPSGWTASQTAPGSEIYVLSAAFSSAVSGITWADANHALSTTASVSSATKFAGDQTGLSVPHNATRKLWFKLEAPTATTVGTEQSIVVTITAQVG